jgi:hypothetical protein
MNFAKGILETRIQTYRHLKSILKCIPLETPTIIELSPGNEIRVTLFDANHCIGAVIFLIEGNGKAIIYTGDMRSETWIINSLRQNPVLIPYSMGIKTLNTIYLDTTFATTLEPYRKFPSKAEGIQELLTKVNKYPKDAKFYFISWTFGYENVWMALSSFLESKIHLDPYRWRLYKSLQTKESDLSPRESAYLCGYKLGNHERSGCLTRDPDARIHSCEHGSGCPYIDSEGNNEVIYIMPVVTRCEDGLEIREMGVGGGKGDINTAQEIEFQDKPTFEALLELCKTKIRDESTFRRVASLVNTSYQSTCGRMKLQSNLDKNGTAHAEDDGIQLDSLIEELVKMSRDGYTSEAQIFTSEPGLKEDTMPNTITFPYSRHSSYLELCEFVAAFQPRDVYPCTVDEENWTSESSIRSLFGQYCSSPVFRHDEEMQSKYRGIMKQCHTLSDTQSTEIISSPVNPENSQNSNNSTFYGSPNQLATRTDIVDRDVIEEDSYFISEVSSSVLPQYSDVKKHTLEREISPPPRKKKSLGKWAYEAALHLNPECQDWNEFGGLVSAQDHQKSFELGSDTEEL